MNAFTPAASSMWRGPVAALLCLFAAACLAQTPGSSGTDVFRVSGFGTVGVVHADAPQGWSYRRDIGQPGHSGSTRADVDSRLGLQLNYAPSVQFELVGQVLATRRSKHAAASDSIEWAFAAYRPQPDVALRIGRVNVDQFLLSEYRNVGFAYRFARPPVEFYATLPTSLDGADATRVWNLADAQWRLKAFVGRAHSGDLSIAAGVDVSPVVGVMAAREADGLLLRVGLTSARLRTETPALGPLFDALDSLGSLPVPEVAAQASALRSELDFAGARVIYANFALNYDVEDWQWTIEAAHISGQRLVSSVAGYAGVGRRFGALTLFAGVGRTRGSARPVEVPAWGAALTPVLGAATAQQIQALGEAASDAANMGTANQRSLSLGLRWDLHPQMAVKLQWDRVRIGAFGGRLWANPSVDAGRANVSSAVLDFVF